MKKLNYLCVALALFILGVAGCKKSADAPGVPEINGVKVDFPKLQHTFDGAGPEIQQNVSEPSRGFVTECMRNPWKRWISLRTMPT